jgi:hypothetical protein
MALDCQTIIDPKNKKEMPVNAMNMERILFEVPSWLKNRRGRLLL